ncbi:MAG: dephospho-CoA kinase [Bacteroidota bacterium]
MKQIGLTGGIGSGKSLVALVFQKLGIPCFNADVAAKEVMDQNDVVIRKIKNRFGADVYSNGKLDRKKFAQIIFADQKAIEFVNHLVHPVVNNLFDCWKKEWEQCPYVLFEAAIIFESALEDMFARVIVVTAPEIKRVERVCQRDQVTPGQVRARMEFQWPEEKKIKLADFVLVNDEKQLLIPQIIDLHNEVIKLED